MSKRVLAVAAALLLTSGGSPLEEDWGDEGVGAILCEMDFAHEEELISHALDRRSAAEIRP